MSSIPTCVLGEHGPGLSLRGNRRPTSVLLGRHGPVLRGQGQWAFLLAGRLGGTERSALFTPSPWAPAHETCPAAAPCLVLQMHRQGYRRSTDEAPRQSLAESSFLLAGSSVLMWLPVYVGFGKSYGFSALQRGRCLKARSSPWAHKDYVPQHPMQPTFPSIPGRLHFPASIVLGDSTDLVPPVGCKGSDPCSHISRVDPACSFPLWLWNEDHHPWRMC